MFERVVVMNGGQPDQFIFQITVEDGEVRVVHPVEMREGHDGFRHRFRPHEAGVFVDAMAEAVEYVNGL
jgi:hypothetical protein